MSGDVPVLLVDGISKNYSGIAAIAQVSLEVGAGEIVGLLGRNGAGKSTAVRHIVGLEKPDEGVISILGRSPAEASRAGFIGYCSQDVALYLTRSVRRNLEFFGSLRGTGSSGLPQRIDDVVDLLGLDDVIDRAAGHLSGGTRRRAHLAVAILTKAPLVVLDEPTAGVDVDSRERIITTVREVAAGGVAILYTSHDLREVERLADRVVILDNGVVKIVNATETLRSKPGQMAVLEFESADTRDRAIPAVEPLGGRARGERAIDLDITPTQLSEVVARCNEDGVPPLRAEIFAPGLESTFLRLVRDGQPNQEPT